MKIKNVIRALMGMFLLFFYTSTVEAQFPAISLVKQISGLSFPVHITHAGDGSERLFIVEQTGRIRIVRNNNVEAVPFLDISGRVLFRGEQGLLSVAFPPGYHNTHFYVYYTNLNGDNVVARYFLTGNPDIANPNSEVILLTLSHPSFENHNGGQLAFGLDGFLYIATGDGGGGGDPFLNGQNPGSLLGKILRIDVESPVTPPAVYNIPPTNPFTRIPGLLREIWALGLRNPFRFSFDRLTGDLYIGDVGQGQFEEIDFQPASSPGGENYGWNIMEGLHCYNSTTCNTVGLTLPISEYDHGQGCSVTGGFVYRGNLHPQIQGIYFYGDYCTGRIWGLKRNGTSWQNRMLLDSPLSISSFGEDESGELYLTNYATGDIYRISSPVKGDFDGDGKKEIAVWRPGDGYWYMIRSSEGGITQTQWGTLDDVPVPGDYDGDGKVDIAVWRISNGYWYIIRSSDQGVTQRQWGTGTLFAKSDIPVPGDYDGDGKTDIAVWRPGDGYWFIIRSSNQGVTQRQWGTGTFVPVPGDYDGDGKTDIAVWSPGDGYWYINRSSDGGLTLTQWGTGILFTKSDIPVPGDYDGDGKADIAVWRPSNGYWYIKRSSDGGITQTQWGATEDIPVPGDYDGDGQTDIAVWRPGDGVWYILRSSDGGVIQTQWGAGFLNDEPINH